MLKQMAATVDGRGEALLSALSDCSLCEPWSEDTLAAFKAASMASLRCWAAFSLPMLLELVLPELPSPTTALWLFMHETWFGRWHEGWSGDDFKSANGVYRGLCPTTVHTQEEGPLLLHCCDWKGMKEKKLFIGGSMATAEEPTIDWRVARKSNFDS